MKEIKSKRLISSLRALFNCAFDFESAFYECSRDSEFIYGPDADFTISDLIRYGKYWSAAYKSGKDIWYIELPVDLDNEVCPSYIFLAATKKQLPKLIDKIIKNIQEYILVEA